MAQIGAQYVQAVDPNPVGSLQAFAGANAPTGWLLCNGSEQPIATYPELYSVLSTTYGALTNGTGGAGSTHFRVPDLRGRMPIGAGNDGSSENNQTRTRGVKGGDTRMPAHTHPIQRTNVAASGQGTDTSTVYKLQQGTGAGYSDTQTSGSGGGDNMPPFLVTNYIIKATSSIPRGGTALGSTPPIVTALPANPQFGEEVDLLSGGVLLRRKWNGSQWVVVASGARQVLNAYSAMTPAERQDIMVNAWVNINGLEITLTPVSTSSRFIMEANIHHSGTYVSSFSFSRNGTVVASHGNVNENGAIATSYWNNAVDNAYMITTPLGYVDAPATTSSVTYRVVGTSSWNGETNRIMRINDRGTDMRSISNFSIWEVAS